MTIEQIKATIQNKDALNFANSQSLRSVFFISDGTAITSETLGRSILSQFPTVPFETRVIPYVDTLDRADEAVNQINLAHQRDGVKPLVFDTIVDPVIRERINGADAFNLDIYEGLISKIADEIKVQPAPHTGHAHGDVDSENYKSRIDAVHFALDNDDGARTTHYDAADIILIGVSRSGKTPTSLYLALQFGIRAANYPLTEDDLYENSLPKALTSAVQVAAMQVISNVSRSCAPFKVFIFLKGFQILMYPRCRLKKSRRVFYRWRG